MPMRLISNDSSAGHSSVTQLPDVAVDGPKLGTAGAVDVAKADLLLNSLADRSDPAEPAAEGDELPAAAEELLKHLLMRSDYAAKNGRT